jgi:prepilin-type N-terminal cleavage/methylation domain-containing protein
MRNKIFHRNKSKKGFTLIELLIVIAIIGLLASAIMYLLSTGRAKGRDAKRIADLKQLDTAIQTYITDNGHAPYLDPAACTNNPSACLTSNPINPIKFLNTAQASVCPLNNCGGGETTPTACDASHPSTDCYAFYVSGSTANKWLLLQAELYTYLRRLPRDPVCGSGCANQYKYYGPAVQAAVCNGTCGLNDTQLNSSYTLYGPGMELRSPITIQRGIVDPATLDDTGTIDTGEVQ